MVEQCGSEPTIDEEEEEYERARRARVDEYDCSFSSRELAALLVDTEDELGADVDGMCTGMHADVAEARAEVKRLRGAWRVAVATLERYRHITRGLNETLAFTLATLTERVQERDRYRLAWLSARRRAARESVMATEAVEHLTADRDRWRQRYERLAAELDASRKTTHAPRLECVGADEDGPVYRLA